MAGNREEIKERIRAVLKGLSPDEQRLLNHVLKTEQAHLNQKNPKLTDDIVKIVKQVIT